MIREAIILAGGLGTRLRSAVPDLPKCMAPVAGKPFISFVIDYYIKQGTERFIFSVGYKHEVIEEFLDKEYKHLDFVSVVETEPLGTGGAIYKAASLVKNEHAIVLNGDTFFEIDLPSLSDFHIKKPADCTICLKEMTNTDRYGVVETDSEGRIISFKEKNFYKNSVINGGVYALNIASFTNEKFKEKFSMEKDYFESLVKERQMYGLKQEGYFIDIGIPADFEKAQKDFGNA